MSPTPTFTTDWADDNPLTEDILDDFSASIVTFLTTTKLADDNIQAGGISSTNLASSCVTAVKIAASAIETAKINDLAVTTGKINDLAVTTGKIAANAVTRAKLESVGQQVSSSSAAFSTSSTSYTDVTNLTVTITTTGRPVFLSLVSGDAGTSPAYIGGSTTGVAGVVDLFIKFLRDATTISEIQCRAPTNSLIGVGFPCGGFTHIDVPSSGTYTYKVQTKAQSPSVDVTVQRVKLIAYEL
jgi:hypothetical protein